MGPQFVEEKETFSAFVQPTVCPTLSMYDIYYPIS